MGTVYLAHDTQLDRPVALKVPRFGPEPDAAALERFYREARAAALLHHPNICPVYDVGEIDGIHFLTMAYIEGQTLAATAEGQALPQRQAAALVQTLALALEEAHSQGVIHRDLKPANIMLNKRREPVIMDFGLARRLSVSDPRLTHEGMLMGTPAYMSPEQVNGEVDAVGKASDIYTLGIILYELLTGQRPWKGPATSVLAQIITQDPVLPSKHRPDLDLRLEAICRKAMARDPSQRFASMGEFAEALGAYLRDDQQLVPVSESARSAPFFKDPQLCEEVLMLMRTWGWGMGLKKLKATIQAVRDDGKRRTLQTFLRWLSGEADVHVEALRQLQATQPWPALVGWALAGQAAEALRDRQYPRAHKLLDQAASSVGAPTSTVGARSPDRAPADDTVLRATIAHTRGTIFAHQGKAEQALPQLNEALALFGKEHFNTGRVLDTLGMVYAGKGNFHVAREFYEQAIEYKQRQDDEAGLALSHGQLGRLYLDWGHLDQAEEHFQTDLRLAQKLLDERGEAQMYNHLGQVALARGLREAAAGRKAAARRQWTEAAGWLDVSIRRSTEGERIVAEAFARKDRALVALMEGDIAAAEQQAKKAEELFHSARFDEGMAQVHRVWGMVRRAQERYAEAERMLRAALAHFDDSQDHAEGARTQWEIARTLHAARAQPPLVTRAFVEALERAEACRRAELVRTIEEELREVDPEVYLRHIYRRVRGRGASEDTPSLTTGASEVVTVMFLELQGFAACTRGMDPEEVMMTLNQMMADLEVVLDRHDAKVTTYFGDGFMVLLREARNAERAVQAALDLVAALQEFNRPREVLGLPLYQARIGINTGSAFLGNVGTYHKMSSTAVGTTVVLASRLLSWAEPGLPCISRSTYELVQEEFTCKAGNPRLVTPMGFNPCQVWDVSGRR
jgi:class 3 adenylate cyclase/predicted Ser/Thr protein kinase